MNLDAVSYLRCPQCRNDLTYVGGRVTAITANDARDGSLYCTREDRSFDVVHGIPRFTVRNYTSSFGFQWNEFGTTQLDQYWSAPISEKRFLEETRWPADLRGQLVLEVGSGSGRFTKFAARTGAQVFALDASSAIDMAAKNNSHHENVTFVQASLYSMPFPDGLFDKIYCFGVLQHTPSPKKAFLSLVPFLKPGGEIVVDVYRISWRTPFLGKYYLRPFTKRMDERRLLRLVTRWVKFVFPITGGLQRLIGGHARKISWALAVADYRGIYELAPDKQFALSVLDTFDMLSPAYDRPQTISAVKQWCREAGLENVEVKSGYNGIEARGRRSSVAAVTKGS